MNDADINAKTSSRAARLLMRVPSRYWVVRVIKGLLLTFLDKRLPAFVSASGAGKASTTTNRATATFSRPKQATLLCQTRVLQTALSKIPARLPPRRSPYTEARQAPTRIFDTSPFLVSPLYVPSLALAC